MIWCGTESWSRLQSRQGGLFSESPSARRQCDRAVGGEASRRRASEGVLHVTSHLGSSVEENKYDLIGCDNRRNITKGVRLGQLVLGEPVSHSSTNNLPSIEDLNIFLHTVANAFQKTRWICSLCSTENDVRLSYVTYECQAWNDFFELIVIMIIIFLELDDQIMLQLVLRDRRYFLYMSLHIKLIYPEHQWH